MQLCANVIISLDFYIQFSFGIKQLSNDLKTIFPRLKQRVHLRCHLNNETGILYSVEADSKYLNQRLHYRHYRNTPSSTHLDI